MKLNLLNIFSALSILLLAVTPQSIAHAESEVTDVDIGFESAQRTYEASGRVIDRNSGKPVPRVTLSFTAKLEGAESPSGFSKLALTDGQGNFRLPGFPAGRYQVRIIDDPNQTGYVSDVSEFEITNNNVNGIEVKAFPGAVISGVVVTEGGDAAAEKQAQPMMIHPLVMLMTNSAGAENERYFSPRLFNPAKVNADGSFAINGLQECSVIFELRSPSSSAMRIRRIERDGVEIKDAIEVKPGDKISGVRIMVFQPRGRIRGQVQVAGGALPFGRRLQAQATPVATADGSKSGAYPVVIDKSGGSAFVDEKGRFVIDGLAAGEYQLSVYLSKDTKARSWLSADPPKTNQSVTVKDNDETAVTVTFDMNRKSQGKQ